MKSAVFTEVVQKHITKNYTNMRKKKFIVVEDIKGNIQLRFGYPFYHRDLLCRNEDCLGGGEWDIDFDTKQIKLINLTGLILLFF